MLIAGLYAIFYVDLRLIPDVPNARPGPGVNCSMTSILVVEDDADIRESVIELLSFEGFAVESAPNGAEALHYLECNPAPHLILLDLMMPVMDGFGFRDRQKAHPTWSRIPVIVMSADGNILEKQARTTAAAYIRKPIDIDDLLALIRIHSLPDGGQVSS